MSDTSLSPDEQSQLAAAQSRLDAAGDQDTAKNFTETLTGLDEKTRASIGGWMAELPRNADLGLLNLAVNTADSIKHFGLAVADKVKGVARDASGAVDYVKSAATSARTAGVAPGAQAEPAGAVPPPPPPPTTLPPHDHDGVYDVVRQKVLDFRDSMARDQQEAGRGGPLDQVTQSLIQLGVPFTGYAKLLGGLRGAGALESIFNTAIAGGATDVTAIDAHAEQTGRAADLLALGRHTEGKFGDALMAIAPDGSAMNGFINYLTDRNETIAEGHWKNVLDGLLVNAATQGLLHSAGATLKGGYVVAKYAAANAGELGPVGLRAQRGMVVFHGTAADFVPAPNNPLGEFDLSKVGTGEGAQVRGHGIYLAESPDTAGTYQTMLGRRNIPPGSALDLAHTAVSAASGDTKKAYTMLREKMTTAENARDRDVADRAAELVRGGNITRLGRVYHADLPDETIGKMLDQDKLMSEQPDILKQIPGRDQVQLKKVLSASDLGDDFLPLELGNYNGNQFRQIVERAFDEGYLEPSQPISPHFTAARAASEYLNEHDIPGSKYFDQLSRTGRGEGTRNFVLFDPKHAKIIKKE